MSPYRIWYKYLIKSFGSEFPIYSLAFIEVDFEGAALAVNYGKKRFGPNFEKVEEAK